MSVSGNSDKRPIPLILISGFLGSGKTTFLNNLFDNFPDSRFGIIVNDFGGLGVDAAGIKAVDGNVVSELNNGQIFCSCLSGSFIKSVSAYADKDIDFLLVEASGLAKPSPLLEIINAIKALNGSRFSYHGMVSLVDAGSYLELSGVLKAVDEQIAYSDLVLLNKIDTADASRLKKTEMKIMTVSPEAEVIRTVYGRISAEDFLRLGEREALPGPDRRFAGWGPQGRPEALVLQSDNPLSYSLLEAFTEDAGGDYYRLKGRIETDRGRVLVDCTVNSRCIEPDAGGTGSDDGLVIIIPADDKTTAGVRAKASEIFSSVV